MPEITVSSIENSATSDNSRLSKIFLFSLILTDALAKLTRLNITRKYTSAMKFHDMI